MNVITKFTHFQIEDDKLDFITATCSFKENIHHFIAIDETIQNETAVNQGNPEIIDDKMMIFKHDQSTFETSDFPVTIQENVESDILMCGGGGGGSSANGGGGGGSSRFFSSKIHDKWNINIKSE